jgi:glycine cleavage system transcriptional repressor
MNTLASPRDYLVITATGEDQVGLVQRFTSRIVDAGCNIEESRMSLLGGQFAIIMLVSGRWDALTRLEDRLATVGTELGLAIVQKRTKELERKTPLVPYSINVVAMDHPGIVHNLANFFAQRNINIEELSTDTYPAPHTGTPMFSVNMTVGIPAETHIPTLRGDFLDYCDSLNLDAIFEPARA